MTLPLLSMLHVASYEHDGCGGGGAEKKEEKGHVSKGEKFVFAVELTAFCSPKAHKESVVSPAELVKGSPANHLSTRWKRPSFRWEKNARYSLTMAPMDRVSAATATMMTIMVN